MNYQETLDFLFQQLPMFHRVGASAYKKDLGNIRVLTDFLGEPQKKYPTIHIAGTNGKGSTAHMMSAILQAKGLKTGLYISPHYLDFRERIKVNGNYVSKDFVVEFTERMSPMIASVEPSYFELILAMAFEYFAAQEVDVAVIEVGMGGRFDSTNIITPELSIITNISFDHQQFLGDTLPLIAGEKAGIIKSGIPVVIGETHSETASVFLEKAQQMGVPIIFADQHFAIKILQEDLEHTSFGVKKDGVDLYLALSANLHGGYQEKNLQTVLQAVEWLPKEWQIGAPEIQKGLYELKSLTRFIGRWQVISRNPTVLCDSAHNEGGLKLAMEQLATIPRQRLHVVMGMLNDKDISKMLALFPQEGRYYFARPDIPRGLEAAQLKGKAADYGLQGRTYSSVRNALKAARRAAQPDDLIYVGGSTFVLAEIL
jgi:dihydrofolate synthase/folylpolyglutamate synthase